MPREIVSILEGEGLVNDATALVTYRLAVVAAVTGAFSPSQAAVQFLVGGAGGVAIGLLIGVIVARVHRVTQMVPVVSNTVSLLTPFASYLLADQLGASGVLSVVATGLYAARTVPTIIGAEARVQITGMWTVVTFMLESLVFILVGLELPYVARALDRFPRLGRQLKTNRDSRTDDGQRAARHSGLRPGRALLEEPDRLEEGDLAVDLELDLDLHAQIAQLPREQKARRLSRDPELLQDLTRLGVEAGKELRIIRQGEEKLGDLHWSDATTRPPLRQ
jgi:hypothetical protein